MADPGTPRRRQRLAHRSAAALLLSAMAVAWVRCRSVPPPAPEPMAIVAAGVEVPIGTRVVTWREPNAYDAYREGKFFADGEPPDGRRRYSARHRVLPAAFLDGDDGDGPALDELRQIVHLFVLHFDAAGTSRQCFKVLHDVRVLSVHFLLDVDGTIYQTLDLREKAWHATIANDGSVGVEIAHPGAFRQPLQADMRRWYEQDELGWRMRFPAFLGEPGVRTPDFVPRPDRPEPIAGPVQGAIWYQFDYTPQQYAALARLCAGVHRVFPRIRLDAPRRADGTIIDHALTADELHGFDGIVGHFHVQRNKQDPGPALQWERVLQAARAIAAQPAVASR